MAQKIAGAKAALAAFKEGQGAGVLKFDITSNEDTSKTVSIVNGIVVFQYYESLLQDCIRTTVSFTDSGNTIDGKGIMEGLPIYGSERASIKVEDNNDGKLEAKLYAVSYTHLTLPTTPYV